MNYDEIYDDILTGENEPLTDEELLSVFVGDEKGCGIVDLLKYAVKLEEECDPDDHKTIEQIENSALCILNSMRASANLLVPRLIETLKEMKPELAKKARKIQLGIEDEEEAIRKICVREGSGRVIAAIKEVRYYKPTSHLSLKEAKEVVYRIYDELGLEKLRAHSDKQF